MRLVDRRPVVEQPAAVGTSSSTLSPQSVEPLNGALPVATRIRPVPGSITGAVPPPDRGVAGGARYGGTISVWRFEHSEFHTAVIRPVARSIVTTWPW